MKDVHKVTIALVLAMAFLLFAPFGSGGLIDDLTVMLYDQYYDINQSNHTYLKLDQTNFQHDDWVIYDENTYEFYFNQSKLQTIFYNVTNISVITGTPEGILSYIQLYDEISYNVSESSSDLELRLNFSNVDTFSEIVIRYASIDEDEPHDMAVQLYDYTDDEWEDYGTLTANSVFQVVAFGVFDPQSHIQSGLVQLRFYQDEGTPPRSHKHQFDWVTLTSGHGPSPGAEQDPLSLHLNGDNRPTANINWGGQNLSDVGDASFKNVDINGALVVNKTADEAFIVEDEDGNIAFGVNTDSDFGATIGGHYVTEELILNSFAAASGAALTIDNDYSNKDSLIYADIDYTGTGNNLYGIYLNMQYNNELTQAIHSMTGAYIQPRHYRPITGGDQNKLVSLTGISGSPSLLGVTGSYTGNHNLLGLKMDASEYIVGGATRSGISNLVSGWFVYPTAVSPSGTYNRAALVSSGDTLISSNVRLLLEGSYSGTTLTLGDTYLIYNTSTQQIDFFINDRNIVQFRNTSASDNHSIKTDGNILAKGYDVQTTIYDKEKGDVWDYILDADEYIEGGQINHSKFYGGSWMMEYNYSRPIYGPVNITEHFYIEENKSIGERQVEVIEVLGYEKDWVEYTKLEDEINAHRQALFDINNKLNVKGGTIKKIDEHTVMVNDTIIAEGFITATPRFFSDFDARYPHYLRVIEAHQNGTLRDTEGKIRTEYIPNECKNQYGSYEIACLSEYFIELNLDAAERLIDLRQEHNQLKECLLLPTVPQIQNCVRQIGGTP